MCQNIKKYGNKNCLNGQIYLTSINPVQMDIHSKENGHDIGQPFPMDSDPECHTEMNILTRQGSF